MNAAVVTGSVHIEPPAGALYFGCVRRTFLDLLPPACAILRDYQTAQVHAIADAVRCGLRRVIAQAPTGAGKTHLIASVAAAASAAGLRTLVLATRTRLIRQLHERLEAFAVDHGVIAAELPQFTDSFPLVQIASADTLYRRALVAERMPLPPADIVIFDECHLAAAESRLAILERYPRAQRFGFSATPARRSGRSLAEVFDHLILGPSIPVLITTGMLVKPRVFSVPVMTQDDLQSLPKDTSRDFQTGAASKLMRRPKLIGDVLENWLRIAKGKRTLVFVCDKAHGAELKEKFLSAGVAIELLTDEDDEATRETAIADLEAGKLQVLVSCFLLGYGVDIPSVECIVLARPTRSVVLYLQAVGRGLRPWAGKNACFVVDHGRVIENLGLPTDDFGWSLDVESDVNREAASRNERKAALEQPRTCRECKCTWLVSEEGEGCPHCGWKPAPKALQVRTVSADLVELGGSASPSVHAQSPEVMEFAREALGWYVAHLGFKNDRWKLKPNSGRAWAWHKTRERFGITDMHIPSRIWSLTPADDIRPEVAGWLYSRHIRDKKAWLLEQRRSATW